MESTKSVEQQKRALITDFGWGPSDHADADLQIISTDNVVFWFSSTVLARHSPVFRSMVSVCKNTSSTVQLSDPDFEISWRLGNALGLIVSIEDDDSKDSDMVVESSCRREIIQFAQKYEIKSIISAIKLYLHGLVTRYPPEGGEYFLVAAQMCEWTLCGRLIGALKYQPDDLDSWDFEQFHIMLDWRRWTPSTMDWLGRMGTKFVWAICRAGMKQASASEAVEIDPVELGKDVATLMMMDEFHSEAEAASWS